MDCVIILGAHSFPESSFSDNKAFLRAKRSFDGYIGSTYGLNINTSRILDLFDSTKNSVDQITTIADFLTSQIKSSDSGQIDVLLYYVGHGYVPSGAADTVWAIAGTDDRNSSSTGIDTKYVADLIASVASSARIFGIIDCCYSGATARAFMSDKPRYPTLESKIKELPESSGVALLCSSAAEENSYALKDGAGTVFTNSILEILTKGWGVSGQDELSFANLYGLLVTRINSLDLNFKSKPQLFDPRQDGARISDVRILPVSLQQAEGADGKGSKRTKQTVYDTADAIVALRLEVAAGTLLPKLLNTISNAEVDQTAYAIKSRVKTSDGLLEKAERKRNYEGKVGYTVESITDVIGIRLITLFRAELLDSISEIVKLLTDETDVNPNHVSCDEITEIIIYTTEPEASATGFPRMAKKRISGVLDRGKPDWPEIVVKYRREYSSIHIVTKYSDGGLSVPVEWQLRTVFEDAWASVDHKLRYKDARHTKSMGANKPISAETHLKTLKKFLDATSDFCETIFDEMGVVKEKDGQFVEAIDGQEEFIKTASEVGANERMTSEVAILLKQKDDWDRRMSRLRRGSKNPEDTEEYNYNEVRNGYAELAEALEKAFLQGFGQSGTISDVILENEGDAFLIYTLLMEEAFCRISSGLADEALSAIKIYGDLMEYFPRSPVAAMRSGQANSNIGKYDKAILSFDRYRKIAESWLEEGGTSWLYTADQKDYMDGCAYRLEGFAYWREFRRIWDQSDSAGVREDAAICLLNAWQISTDGLNFAKEAEDIRRLKNNRIWYFYEMLLLPEPHQSEVNRGMPDEKWLLEEFNEFLVELEGQDWLRLEVLDTINVIGSRLEMTDVAKDAAYKIMDALNDTDAMKIYDPDIVESSGQNAWKTIRQHIRP